MSSPPYTNIFGRKPGRGVRPWLLIPKVIAVATFVGGYVATIVSGEIVIDRDEHTGALPGSLLRGARSGHRLWPTTFVFRPRDTILRPDLHRHANDFITLFAQ